MLYGRPRRHNPELLSVYNPPLSSGAKMFVRRARAMNYPLTIVVNGKRYTFRELTNKFGAKKAARLWRKNSTLGHGRKVLSLVGSIGKKHREHVKSRRHKEPKDSKKAGKATPKKKARKATPKRKPRKSHKSKGSRKGKAQKSHKSKGSRKGKAQKSHKSKGSRKGKKAGRPSRGRKAKSKKQGREK